MSGWNIDDVEILADPPAVVGAPRLTILLPTPVTAVIWWPTNATRFVLQQNSDLTTTNWVDVASTISIVGTNNQVSPAPLNAGGFFRLIQR